MIIFFTFTKLLCSRLHLFGDPLPHMHYINAILEGLPSKFDMVFSTIES